MRRRPAIRALPLADLFEEAREHNKEVLKRRYPEAEASHFTHPQNAGKQLSLPDQDPTEDPEEAASESGTRMNPQTDASWKETAEGEIVSSQGVDTPCEPVQMQSGTLF